MKKKSFLKASRVIILILIILVLLGLFICCDNKSCSENGGDNTQLHSSEMEENQQSSNGEDSTQPVSCPWDDDGAKQPSDYTWDEYEALSADQKVEFFEWFSVAKEFDDWLMANEPKQDLGDSQGMPWDDPDALQPKDYSYEQYEALTGEQQVAFIEWFPTTKDFDDWLMANEPELDLGE